MRSGEKISYDGYQVALFPMDYLYITQTSSPSSLSHCCGHPIDIIGSYATYPLYAPCDCTRIYTGSDYVIYASNNPVWTPNGLTYITFEFGHDNNPPSKTSFLQGELIGHTGTKGYVTGDHCHLDQSALRNATLVNSGITCSGGNVCWMLNGSEYPYNIFYLSGSESVVSTQGYTFKVWDKPITSSKFKWWMARLLLERRRHG